MNPGRIVLRSMLAVALASVPASAQVEPEPQAPQTAPAVTGSPVIFGTDTLFYIQTPLGPFGTTDRATGVASRLQMVADDPIRSVDSVYAVPGDTSTDIMIGDAVVTAVTDADAALAGISRDSLVALRISAIRGALSGSSVSAIARVVLLGLLFTAITAAIFAAILFGLGRLFPVVYAKLDSWRTTRIPAIRIQGLELASANQVTDTLIALTKIVRVVLMVALAFYLVPLVLSFFPWTAPLAGTVLAWVITPLRQAWQGFVAFLPNLFTIAVIMVVVYYLNRFISLFFLGIERGAITFSGFYRDWADPTYKIVRMVVIAFGAIMIWPYLPGSGSDAFQGVSVFLGVLITFGSAGAVANVIAGVVMTYMRPFQIGDRVKIADTVGDVTKRTLLVTRIRTIKNVDVTIPNAMVLSSHIINYSSSAKHKGLILNTTITIGYDVPWKKVHEALLAAAAGTQNVLAEPKPFVLQTALNDFYVHYELNAYTDQPNTMAATYSALHQNIQDRFNEASIEIMSPHYSAMRDGNQTTIPEGYLPSNYEAPSFRHILFGSPKSGPGA